MPREMVVYSYRSGWWAAVVASTTKKAARAALGITQNEFNNYVGETGNENDIAVALKQPGLAFIQPLDARGEDKAKWWVMDGLRPWHFRDPDVVMEFPEKA